jgi:hypothetical protein
VNPPFGGLVDVFDTDGNLLTPNHFAANSPGACPLENSWAVVQAPASFGAFSNALLIGNVEGAGSINAFDPATSSYLGQLRHPDGTPIAIPGLWDLVFGTGTPDSGKTNQLFFDGGPNAPNLAGNGLFGVIQAAGDQAGNSQADHITLAAVDPQTAAAVSGLSTPGTLPHETVGDADLPLLRRTASPRVSAVGIPSFRSLPNQAAPASDQRNRPAGTLGCDASRPRRGPRRPPEGPAR